MQAIDYQSHRNVPAGRSKGAGLRLNVVEDGLAERLDIHVIRDVNLLKALLDELLRERLIVPVKGGGDALKLEVSRFLA